MSEITKTMKLRIHTDKTIVPLLKELTTVYSQACNHVSEYVFNNGFVLNFMKLQEVLYTDLRSTFGLKSQLTQSVFKTVTARYKTVKEQLLQNPYRYTDENGDTQYITKTLEWLLKPVHFHRPQADLVRGRDYSFVKKGLSINTLDKRVVVKYSTPECFDKYFDGTCWHRKTRLSQR